MKKRTWNGLGALLLTAWLLVCCMVPAFAAGGSNGDLQVKRAVEGTVTLSWGPQVGASGYTVSRSGSKDGTYVPLGKTASTSFTDNTAKGRKNYYYKVESASLLNLGKSKTIAGPKKVFVNPKKPRVVILGECFAEGIATYAKDKLPSGYHVVPVVGLNSSWANNRTTETLNGKKVTPVAKAASYNPDRVYLMIGVNEAASWEPSQTITNFKKTKQTLQKQNANLQLVLCSLPPRGKVYSKSLNLATNEKTKQYNQAYKSFADSNQDVYYYDYTTLVTDKDGYLKAEIAAKDGCHWNQSAYRTVAADLVQWDTKLFL